VDDHGSFAAGRATNGDAPRAGPGGGGRALLDAASHVVIIGGGFSGTMQAINLLRHHGPRATLIERRAVRLGRGVAYNAASDDLLLNVRAANMSALPDDPAHFARWLAEHHPERAGGFAPRNIYGAYLRAQLDAAAAGAGDRLDLIAGDVVDVVPEADRVTVHLRDGGRVQADVAVLAVGNLPPHDPPGFDPDRLGPDLYARDPWRQDIAEELEREDSVLLLGTGLTAIDAALLLDARGFAGRIIALSRRGQVPHAHWDQPRDAQELRERPPASASKLVRFMRDRADARGWRDAVDDLRPVTQMMWGAASDMERARFLRHLRPYWDVHRHRLAPYVAARIDALRAAGRLHFVAGKTVEAVARNGGVSVRWRARGAERDQAMTVRRVVNCTGPQGDLLRSDDPLLAHLRDKGQVRADRLRLGLDVDAQSRVIDAAGHAQERLFAIGPMTRGGLWEVVAVPDIRNQVWALARKLANAHWVGGEGL